MLSACASRRKCQTLIDYLIKFKHTQMTNISPSLSSSTHVNIPTGLPINGKVKRQKLKEFSLPRQVSLGQGNNMEVCTTDLAEGVVLLTLTVPFCFLGILGNAIVCVTISLTPSLRKSCNVLIGNLAVTDLLTLLVVEPLMCTILVNRVHNGDCVGQLVRVTRALGYFFCSASLLTITAMSFDRCFAVLVPFRYKVRATNQNVAKGTVIIWILSTAAGLLEGFKVFPRSTCSLLTKIVISILYGVILGCYVCIFIKMKKQAKIRAQMRCGNKEISRKTEKSLVKTILLVSGIFSVCWAPFFYSILVKPDQAFEDPLFRWSAMVGVASSAVNPVVYFYSNKDFRKAAKTMCCGNKSSQKKLTSTPVLNNRICNVNHA